jgi:16S rRNA processing protein RimM
VGRVTGHRGLGGELTVRGSEPAAQWLEVRRFWLTSPAEGRFFEVEQSRAYRDRLVLKLHGIETADGAAQLRGREVFVARSDAPEPGPGVHYVADLVAMNVVDEAGGPIGQVSGVIHTGATDVLRVRPHAVEAGAQKEEAEELLVPLAPEFVRSIDADRRSIVARIPRELRELNSPKRAPD